MKQPEDTRTIELQIDKRGRGRPAKEDKLTPAERAKRYRAKQKENSIKSDVTENEEKEKIIDWEQDRFRYLDQEIDDLKAELKALQIENALVVAERGAAWKMIENLKSDASR